MSSARPNRIWYSADPCDYVVPNALATADSSQLQQKFQAWRRLAAWEAAGHPGAGRHSGEEAASGGSPGKAHHGFPLRRHSVPVYAADPAAQSSRTLLKDRYPRYTDDELSGYAEAS